MAYVWENVTATKHWMVDPGDETEPKEWSPTDDAGINYWIDIDWQGVWDRHPTKIRITFSDLSIEEFDFTDDLLTTFIAAWNGDEADYDTAYVPPETSDFNVIKIELYLEEETIAEYHGHRPLVFYIIKKDEEDIIELIANSMRALDA